MLKWSKPHYRQYWGSGESHVKHGLCRGCCFWILKHMLLIIPLSEEKQVYRLPWETIGQGGGRKTVVTCIESPGWLIYFINIPYSLQIGTQSGLQHSPFSPLQHDGNSTLTKEKQSDPSFILPILCMELHCSHYLSSTAYTAIALSRN